MGRPERRTGLVATARVWFRQQMGDEITAGHFTREERQRYREKVQLCLDVFERMLTSATFDSDSDDPLTGLEVELNLVSDDRQPFLGNMSVLEEIADPAFQTELGAYNIEMNVPPRSLAGDAAHGLEDDLRVSLNAADEKARRRGASIVMIGILPTLMAEHLARPDWMSPSARYTALNDMVFAARGEDVHLDIHGPERLSLYASTRWPPSRPARASSCTCRSPRRTSPSTGTPRRCSPGPQVALGANSPFFFGRELWRETRIELFAQSTDTRPQELKNQGVRPRVWFGERWITSIFDLFEENVRYFPALLPEISTTRTPSPSSRPAARRGCRSCGSTTARSTAGTARSTTSPADAARPGGEPGAPGRARRSSTSSPTPPSTTARCACSPRTSGRSGRR